MIIIKKTINFSSVPENLSLVERLIDEVCKECNVDEEFYGNILKVPIFLKIGSVWELYLLPVIMRTAFFCNISNLSGL